MMGNERQANQSPCQRQQELEVAAGGVIAQRDLEAVVPARDLHLMRRRIRIAETRGAVDLQPEAARRALAIAVAEVAEAPGIAGAVEELGVFQRDLARLARRDGEDPGTNQSLASQLDERGIAFLAYNRLVDGSRLRRIHRFAAQLLITLPQGVAREHRLARKGEVVHAFIEDGPVVAEPLFDGHAGHTPADADLNGAAEPLDPRVVLRNWSNRIDPTLSEQG